MTVPWRAPRSSAAGPEARRRLPRYQQPVSAPAVGGLVADELRRISIRALKGLVRLYQLTLSPFIGGQCRFHPTCSNYALEALERHGPLAGTWLAVKRILKCHPFHPGGIDPPPSTGGQARC